MFRAPTQTPPLDVLLDDILTRDPNRIARHLGVSTRTLARWQATGRAPRLALLALFWETQWGLSIVDCEAFNGARLAAQHVAALERECATLRTRITRLEAVGDFGSANAPTWRAARAAQAGAGPLDAITSIAPSSTP